MVSFIMVVAVALTTLYMGVYVAESLDRMEMRRCPQSDAAVNPDDNE